MKDINDLKPERPWKRRPRLLILPQPAWLELRDTHGRLIATVRDFEHANQLLARQPVGAEYWLELSFAGYLVRAWVARSRWDRSPRWRLVFERPGIVLGGAA